MNIDQQALGKIIKEQIVPLQNNHLVVYDIARRKPWGKVPAKQVSNIFLLIALADYTRGNAGSIAEH